MSYTWNVAPQDADINTKLQSSDSDDDMNTNLIKEASPQKIDENEGRHLTFSLEVVINNRLVDRDQKKILSKLVTYDGHPRDRKKTTSYYDKKTQDETSGTSINDCLEFFRRSEKLDKDNSWYCNVCKDHVQATKTIEIFKTPAVLIFCLQRFKSHGIYLKDKLEDKIDFPVHDLDMKPYVLYHKDAQGKDTEMLYDLFAVSNHSGSLAFGHYTAYGKNHETGVWYDYNDSSVSLVSSTNDEREVVTREAYVLYYVRKDFFPDGNVDYDKIRIALKDDTNTIFYHKQA